MAHGILDDDIYGLEVRVVIDTATREIISAEGSWNRWTTPDCPLAAGRLQDAVGVKIDEQDFAGTLRRTVGTRACRHFANILVECCYSAMDALEVLGNETVAAGYAEPAYSDRTISIESGDSPSQEKRQARIEPCSLSLGTLTGPCIDLHVHTSPASPCSEAPVEELIAEAKRIGLDGICLTDHNHIWSEESVEDLRQMHGYLVLRGNEIITDQGDVIVFGLDLAIRGIIRLEDLRKEAVKAGGFMIAAHPFRGFLAFGVDKLGLTTEHAEKRKLFQYVDAVEVFNGRVTRQENHLACEVASRLDLVQTGGSDAHQAEELGQYATRFSSPVQNERDLIEALRNHHARPAAFRRETEGAGLESPVSLLRT